MPTLVQFHYSDARWRALEEIVERAGGVAARDRFRTQRNAFEKMLTGWKWRLEHWNGRTFARDDIATYKRIEKAARDLNAGLAELGFPAIFTGSDIVWKNLATTDDNPDENKVRFAGFTAALDHIAARAAMMASEQRRKRTLMRDRFFGDLGEFWRVELGLRITASIKSPFVRFVEDASSEGVYQFGNDDTARDVILNVVRSWPRGSMCKNRGEET